MPQVKTKDTIKSRKKAVPAGSLYRHPTLTDACDLINKMLEYETTARTSGVDLTSGRFKMLTASERQVLRAELIADYIRLSAGNMGNTPGYFDATLKAFTSKICDMSIPSHELIGTYLAAVDIATKDDRLTGVPKLNDAIRLTMVSVLQSCVEFMRTKMEQATEVKTAAA